MPFRIATTISSPRKYPIPIAIPTADDRVTTVRQTVKVKYGTRASQVLPRAVAASPQLVAPAAAGPDTRLLATQLLTAVASVTTASAPPARSTKRISFDARYCQRPVPRASTGRIVPQPYSAPRTEAARTVSRINP